MLSNKKFYISVKQKVILSLIGLVFVFLTAYIKGCFTKDDKAKTETIKNVQSNSQTSNGTQYNSQRDIIITNNTNDANKKEPNIKYIKEKEPQIKILTNKSDTQFKLQNNGIINNGGQGNVYNQNIINGKIQRHLKPSDIELIKQNIPLGYFVEVCSTLGDQETEILANEIVFELKKNNIKSDFGGGAYYSNPIIGKVVFTKIDSLKILKIAVNSDI